MFVKEGKYTVETFAKSRGIKRQSAINLLSKLKSRGLVVVNGGGKQKRIYTVSNKPIDKENKFYDIINKYNKEKLIPKFKHKVIGKYTIEHAIIEGIKIGDARTKEATKKLFNHIKNWKRLFDLAKEEGIVDEIHELYDKARKTTKCRKMPKRYRK